MEVMRALHMNKGNGDTSYAQNSMVQGNIIVIGKAAIEAAITEMLTDQRVSAGSFGIADLGCSSGPNTFSVITQILDTIRGGGHDPAPPELRIFLNDLYSNDFNNIFSLLPAFYDTLRDKGFGSGSCFVLGVPGSFYGRLFPASTLHFVHSSSSLHWLSQVPAGLGAENKGKLYISKSSPKCVIDAYASQFEKDFSLFLSSRSPEVAAGGRMVLSFMGRPSADPTTEESCYHWELLAHALMALVNQEKVEEEKIDTFNAPYYAPSPEEIKAEVEKEGSFFIQQLKGFNVPWDGCSDQISSPVQSRGTRVARTIRAVVESMVESHFGLGEEEMDHLFGIYAEMVNNYLSLSATTYLNLVITLVRKD